MLTKDRYKSAKGPKAEIRTKYWPRRTEPDSDQNLFFFISFLFNYYLFTHFNEIFFPNQFPKR